MSFPLAVAPPLSQVALAALPDAALLARQDQLAAERRRVDAELAAVAGEIARRSTREAGFGGIAQRAGYRTPERYLEESLGVSRQEASALVRVGLLDPADPRDGALVEAVAAGEISVIQADEDLRARRLAEQRAIDRERTMRERRSLILHRLPDGMTRLVALFDPESAAIVTSAFDAITAPRRGTPRVVDPRARDRAEAIRTDPRTTEQLALDGLVDLLRIAVAVDHADDAVTRKVLGAVLPAVRIHVTDQDLARRAVARAAGRSTAEVAAIGSARIEGQPEPVAAGTAERHLCTAGSVPIHFDSGGQVVNVGRDHRLFTARQRIGLAARDGGCRWPGCDRPPSWCEAHHIDEWDAHHGRTDIADGLLLCRFHHLLVHDRGWRIRRGTDALGAVEYVAATDGERVVLPAKARLTTTGSSTRGDRGRVRSCP